METSLTVRNPITRLQDLSRRVIEEKDLEKQEEEEGEVMRKKGNKRGEGERVQCMTLHKRGKSKSVGKMTSGKYCLWRQYQKTSATRLEKQLKARWELENLINEQLNRFHAHYNCAMVPHTLKDVAQLLMPGWTPPYALATLSWLGDWRPSVILDLVHGLPRSSSSFKSHLSNSTARLLSQLLREIRIEEAIIDSEITEIQATCILRLPFAHINDHHLPGACLLSCIQAEFKKIERVIIKAQQLRYRALELVVRKVLSPVDAAQFLVAFAGIQEAIHQFATKQKLPKGPLAAPRVKILEVKSSTAVGNLPGNPKSVYKKRK